MNSAFSGTPFVAGSIRGERCWKVGSGGTLISPQQSASWRRGENVSSCEIPLYAIDTVSLIQEKIFHNSVEVLQVDIKTRGWSSMHTPTSRTVNTNTSSGYYEPYWEEPQEYCIVLWREQSQQSTSIYSVDWRIENKPSYVVSGPFPYEYRECKSWFSMQDIYKIFQEDHQYSKCSCGFYAYLNGINDYALSNPVVGIIEGYGLTAIGTRGFRAEKAKILALAPTKPLTRKTTPKSEPFFSVDPANLSSDGFKRWGLVGGRKSGRSQIIYDLDQELQTTYPPYWLQLQKNYPDVAFFDDPNIMRARFPATNLDEVL